MNEAKQLESPTSTLSARTLDSLRSVSILRSLDTDTLRCLETAQEIHRAPGDVLVHEGEAVHQFWILLEGSIKIVESGPDGREMTLHVLDRGETFGEVALLTGIAPTVSMVAAQPCELLQLSEENFWALMTSCPEVRKAILHIMAQRLAKMQKISFQQEKMASLGTMAAGLMHELNNPGSAARRASAQLRENLQRMHRLTARFSRSEQLTNEQKQCLFDLQELALAARPEQTLSSIEQADAEEDLVQWMESANIEDAWKLAPTFVSIGFHAEHLECARASFKGGVFSDAISWLEALVSSMQLVGTIEESIGRVTDLVQAVKSYAYEGRTRQQVDINRSIHATLLILGHKMREKQVTLSKNLAADLPTLETSCHGLNQVWTNLLDNAIDAVAQQGSIRLRTWLEESGPHSSREAAQQVCILVGDDGPGIPLECQSRVFDPFFTTKPVGVGTGLGLGIVYRIVEQYGGTIHFSSAPGSTEFVVRLPVRLPDDAAAVSAAAAIS